MSSRPRPQRKATKRLYANDGAPVGSDVELSEGEQATRRGGRGVNKGKGKGKTTKSKGKAVVASDGEQEEQDELDSSSEVEQPTKKRKKASKKQRKNSKQQQQKGKLELINTLPVELFAEICSHLGPGDLLALSLTSKAFRSSLISPGSLALWKASRRSVGLPDLTAGDLTEYQYAHLVFGRHCDSCGCKETKLADFSLRKVLCNPCREKNWVQMAWNFNKSHPELHPLTSSLALETRHSPTERRYSGAYGSYAFLPDLQAISAKLFELDPQAAGAAQAEAETASVVDEDEALLRELLDDNETNQLNHGSTRTRQPRRPSLYGYQPSTDANSEKHNDGSDDLKIEAEEEEDPEAAVSKKMLAQFVEEKEELKEKAAADGKRLLNVVIGMRDELKRESLRVNREKRAAGHVRRAAIQKRILDEFEDYDEDDFLAAPLWYSSKLINEGGDVDDDEWEDLKPKILKLLPRLKAQQEQAVAISDQASRQRDLRARYKKLLDIQPNKQSRHWLPLFADFLHLASVKELWETDEADPEDDEVWGEHLDAILEELDEYRLDVRLQAVQTILAATTEMDEEELDGDADSFGPDSYDDEWLARPASFLVCSLPKCRARTRRRWSPAGSIAARPTFFGSLPDLLAHQHKYHADFSLTDKQRKKRDQEGVVGHFHLPPLVVSALSSIIELAGVEDDEATVDDLVAATGSTVPSSEENSTNPAYLSWENPVGKKSWFRHWSELIEEAIKQAEKAAKSRSKPVLEVPIIELRDPAADREEALAKMKKERGKMTTGGKRKKKAKKQSGCRRPWDYDSDAY